MRSIDQPFDEKCSGKRIAALVRRLPTSVALAVVDKPIESVPVISLKLLPQILHPLHFSRIFFCPSDCPNGSGFLSHGHRRLHAPSHGKPPQLHHISMVEL